MFIIINIEENSVPKTIPFNACFFTIEILSLLRNTNANGVKIKVARLPKPFKTSSNPDPDIKLITIDAKNNTVLYFKSLIAPGKIVCLFKK